MQKVRVNVQQMNGDVIIPSADGTQFTGIIHNGFIYAKCVYGVAPNYVKIPISATIEATEEYTFLSGFITKELHFQKGNGNLVAFLEFFSYCQIEDNLRNIVDNAVQDEINAYKIRNNQTFSFA